MPTEDLAKLTGRYKHFSIMSLCFFAIYTNTVIRNKECMYFKVLRDKIMQ